MCDSHLGMNSLWELLTVFNASKVCSSNCVFPFPGGEGTCHPLLCGSLWWEGGCVRQVSVELGRGPPLGYWVKQRDA